MKTEHILAAAAFLVLGVFNSLGCSTEQPAAPQGMPQAEGAWSAKDLAAGPVEIVKAPFSLITCPFRLTRKESESISMKHDGVGRAMGRAFLVPFRAVVDGAFTGVGYALGGAIDTVTGGASSLVSSATGDPEPNGNIHCIISGVYE